MGRRLLETIARRLAKRRLPPLSLTIGALVFGLAAGVAAARAHWILFTLLTGLSGLGDALDGQVARARGCATPLGELLDSTFDRYVDFAILAGLAFHFRGSRIALAVTLAAVCGGFLVSYLSARQAAFQLKMPEVPMRRAERFGYLLAGGTLAALSARYADACLLSTIAVIAGQSHRATSMRIRALS